MVKEFKEHWQVAIITGFITMLFTLLGYWLLAKSTKINDAATIEYVDKKDTEIIKSMDDKHKDAINHTNIEFNKLNFQIDKKADKSLVESIDNKLDLILQKLD